MLAWFGDGPVHLTGEYAVHVSGGIRVKVHREGDWDWVSHEILEPMDEKAEAFLRPLRAADRLRRAG